MKENFYKFFKILQLLSERASSKLSFNIDFITVRKILVDKIDFEISQRFIIIYSNMMIILSLIITSTCMLYRSRMMIFCSDKMLIPRVLKTNSACIPCIKKHYILRNFCYNIYAFCIIIICKKKNRKQKILNI